jgi:hypothetical protein
VPLLDEFGVTTGPAAFGVDPAFESKPAGLAAPESSGAVVLGGVTAPDVSLKLILNAPLPQSNSPPVKMNDKLLDGVELQLSPGI